MALIKGDNFGFVTSSPIDDPEGESDITIDNSSRAIKDTCPDGLSATITEIGWWCSNATEEANFEVGVYTDAGAGEPELLITAYQTNAKGTTEEWKRVTTDISITPNTTYWIALQLDDTATATNIDLNTDGDNGYARKSSQTTLLSDWGSSTGKSAVGTYAIYAVVDIVPLPPKADIIQGTSGTKSIKTNWPIQEGLILGTTKQRTDSPYLIEQEPTKTMFNLKKEVKTDWPVEEGLTARTTKQKKTSPNLKSETDLTSHWGGI